MPLIPWSISVISRTVAGVITTADAKDHLRVDHADEDSLIDRLIVASIIAIETKSRSAIVPQTLELRVPRFPYAGGYVLMPRSPVRSITSVKYLDTDLVEQTVDPSVYAINDGGMPARLFLADTSVAMWPTVKNDRADGVRIRYDAGPSTVGGVSDEMISAILLMVGHLYENRQSVVTGTIATKIPDAVESLVASQTIPNGDLGVLDGGHI